MNDFADSVMWSEATLDHDAEARRTAVARAKVAVAGVWPFLAVSQNETEFETRLALVMPSIAEKVPGDVIGEVVAGLKSNVAMLRQEEHQVALAHHTAAISIQATDKGELPQAYVHVHKHGSGDDEYYQVDHVASPEWVKLIGREGKREDAIQKAREFGLPNSLPIYENGQYREGSLLPRLQAGTQFWDAQGQRWITVAAADGDNDSIEDEDAEGDKKTATFTPDPTDAYRYNRYPPTPPSPTHGGSPAGPDGVTPEVAHNVQPPQTGPDGFPVDLSEGEGRSEEAYARQLTPGAWTVTPGTEWRDSTRPNAATGLPQGQYPTDNNAAGWAKDPALSTSGSQHLAQEGVVPTPGPNPNYFADGSNGLAGPPSFPENPSSAIEPKTDNHMDDVYGGVPPQQSSGSSEGQVDGQGYSKNAAWWLPKGDREWLASLQVQANQYIKQQGDSWVITQKGTGKVLSHHSSQEEAQKAFEAMEANKHGSLQPPPFGRSAGERIAARVDFGFTYNGSRKKAGWGYRGDDQEDPDEAAAHFTRGVKDAREHIKGGQHYRLDPDENYHYQRGYDTTWENPLEHQGKRTAGRHPMFRPGDRVQSFRGEDATVQRVYPSAEPGKSHRVQVAWDGENHHPDNTAYYEQVFKHHPDTMNELRHSVDAAVPHADDISRVYASKSASTNGLIVGQCDNCGAPVRYHEGEGSNGVGELRHLHNNKHKCKVGNGTAKSSKLLRTQWVSNGVEYRLPQFFEASKVASMPPDTGAGPRPDPQADVPQVSDANTPQADGSGLLDSTASFRRLSDALERPTPENPTGRSTDEYGARTWDSLVRQRPMQSAEDRNVNTPTLPQAPIQTRNINTPTPGLNEEGPREASDRDETDENQNSYSREA